MPVAGTYTVTIQTPMGAQQGTLTVEPHGDRFTGSVSNPMMGKMEITDGTVSGDTLAWTMAMTSPMPMSLDAEATVNGDAITGSVKAGVFGALALSGVRA